LCGGGSRGPRGFTLIEIILATALMAMVLATLSAAITIFSHLFESGTEQVQRAQWITAIERQLRDDLQSVMEDSSDLQKNAIGASGVAAGARRFSLHGTSRSLRFDVLQMTPEDQIPVTSDVLLPSPDAAAASRVPELKTIVYRFSSEQIGLSRSSLDDVASDVDALSPLTVPPGFGLTRWEIDFETPAETNPATQPTEPVLPGSSEDESSEKKPGFNASFEDILAKTVASNTVTWLPEVRWASFRYFDGAGWSDAWDSLQQGSLPVAVEANVLLHDPAKGESRPGKKLDEAEDTTAGDSPDAAADGTLPLDEKGVPISDGRFSYRFLFHLATARKRPEIKPAAVTAMDRAASTTDRLSTDRASTDTPSGESPAELAGQGSGEEPGDAFMAAPPDLFGDRAIGPARRPQGHPSSRPSSGSGASDASSATQPDQWLRTAP
jgi:prepilin-type N-terminal cleavage/methylation domain-containing protein